MILLYNYAFYSRYNTDWMANTEIVLDPNNSYKDSLGGCGDLFTVVTHLQVRGLSCEPNNLLNVLHHFRKNLGELASVN